MELLDFFVLLLALLPVLSDHGPVLEGDGLVIKLDSSLLLVFFRMLEPLLVSPLLEVFEQLLLLVSSPDKVLTPFLILFVLLHLPNFVQVGILCHIYAHSVAQVRFINYAVLNPLLHLFFHQA